jgi:predicted DNA-binding transcriptional regulator YafY
MLRYADKADTFTATAYEKLATAMPAPIRQPVVDAAYGMRAKAADVTYSKVLGSLVTAWAQGRQVLATYRGPRGRYERTLWPLFLEPSAIGHSCYLIAWDPKPKAVRVYKLERMLDVRVLGSGFDLPDGVSIDELLSRAWAVWASDDVVDVELAFSPEVAGRLGETTWHPSQELFQRDDGRIGMRLHVASWLEIRHWVLGWGEHCEVVAPADLRESVRDTVSGLAEQYGLGISQLVGEQGPVAVTRRRVATRQVAVGHGKTPKAG